MRDPLKKGELKMKNELLNKFNKLYENCDLFAIQLNGFTHTIFYKDRRGTKHIDRYSAYASEEHEESTLCSDGSFRAFNEDKIKILFLGVPHYSYKYNPQELIYKNVKSW